MRFLFVFLFLLGNAWGSELFKIKEKTIKGEDYDFRKLRGKVSLIVNIASQCGYTKQLEGLEKLYRKYKDQGFVILGVPTNDFGGQTPEDNDKMLEFCSRTYDVTFPLLDKRTILGSEKRSLYKFLAEKSPKALQGDVDWNFEKFLLNKEGTVVDRFKSKVTPEDEKLKVAIETLLKK